MFHTCYVFLVFALLIAVEARKKTRGLIYQQKTNSIVHQSRKQKGFLLIGGTDDDGWNDDIEATMELYYPDDPTKNTLLNVSMVVPRSAQASATTPNGLVFTVGGGDEGDVRFADVLNSTEVFDPATMRTHLAGNMSHYRLFPGAALAGDVLYVCGGCFWYDGLSLKAHYSCEMLDSTGKKWKKATSMMQPRCGHGFVALDNRYIYAISGDTSVGMVNTVEKFDTKSKSWTYVQSVNTARAYVGSAVLARQIYICGGLDKDFTRLPNCETYNPSTDHWSSIAKMNQNHYFCTMMSLNGALYIFGGYETNVVKMYTTKSKKWKMLPKGLIRPRNKFSGVVI